MTFTSDCSICGLALTQGVSGCGRGGVGIAMVAFRGLLSAVEVSGLKVRQM